MGGKLQWYGETKRMVEYCPELNQANYKKTPKYDRQYEPNTRYTQK